MRWAEQQQKAQGFWDSALSHKADYGWHIRDRLWIRGETGCGPRETSAQQLKALAGQLRQCPCIPLRVLGLLLPNGMPPAMWSSLPFTIHKANFAPCHSQAPSKPFSARALSAAEVGSDDPDTNAQFGWHRVRLLFLA